MKSKHILVTTDLSEEAQRAFGPVCSLARMIGAKVTLLHVIPALAAASQGAMLGTPVGTSLQPEEDEESAQKALEVQAALLDSQVDSSLQLIKDPNVAKAIVHYADDNDIGLIALSTHGRSGMRRMVMGSVAEDVLRHSNIPVLCFPPPPGLH